MSRPPLDGTVLVTGASSGIGLELSKLFAARAKRLVLVARRKDRLDALADELGRAHPSLEVRAEACDLGAPDEAVRLVERLAGEGVDIDVLVNNAGVGLMGMLDLAEPARVRAMLDLNVTSLVALTQACVGPMVARGRGGILNISSGAGLTLMPGFAAYVGTKHFVTGFSEALRCDLSGTGVTVTQVCPGPVATEFEQNAGNFTGMKVPGLIEISALTCARQAFAGFRRGRAIVVPGLVMKVLLGLAALTPRWVVRLYTSFASRLMRKRELATRV
ncbi:MAG: SDR family oxidoreductase [Myxococcales bacterium]|nr:SDR family oxidoreductase [Myxococcales bacterium]MBL0192759.1 SDR family oxidoreductase [Myxococcales bacterium]HQY62520.1 SDR family oxidoreductase [Polyangiaceae bacterium]